MPLAAATRHGDFLLEEALGLATQRSFQGGPAAFIHDGAQQVSHMRASQHCGVDAKPVAIGLVGHAIEQALVPITNLRRHGVQNQLQFTARRIQQCGALQYLLLQAGIELAHTQLGSLGRTNIPYDFHNANAAAIGPQHGSPRHRHIQQAAVLVHTRGIKRGHHLAVGYAREKVGVFLGPVRR